MPIKPINTHNTDDLKSILADAATLKTQPKAAMGIMSALEASLASSGSLLSKLETYIHHLEMGKYPNPPYDSRRSSDMTYVGYTPEQDDPVTLLRRLEHIKHYAFLVRVNTLTASLLYNMTSDEWPSNIVEKVTKRVEALALQEAAFVHANQEVSFDTYERTNYFIAALAKIVSEETRLPLEQQKKYIKDRERYYLSHKKQPVIVNNIYQKDGTTITQIDVPFRNPLTKAQKESYLAIHEKNRENRPTWFNKLSLGEQKWYRRFVPTSLEPATAWEQFEAMNFTSAMQQGGAGVKNTRTNYLIHERPGEMPEILSKSLKTATIVPIEVKDKAEKKKLAELNAEQLLDALVVDANINFEKQWGIAPSTAFKPILYVHSLLSPLLKNLGDTNMVKTQLAAVHEVMHRDKYKNYHIVVGNDPVNMFRAFVRNRDNWEHTKEILRAANNLLANLPDNILKKPEQEKKVKLITELCDKLVKLEKTAVTKGRNRRALKSAYEQMLVMLLGGVDSENCKSGKDRTGLDEIYKASVLLYYNKYGQLPAYDDAGVKRQNFIHIFKMLYQSLKIHESASMNTHGAFGIKDQAASKMLDPDIAEALGHHYSASDKRANLNKPHDPNWIKKIIHVLKDWFYITEPHPRVFAIQAVDVEKENKKTRPFSPQKKGVTYGAKKLPPIPRKQRTTLPVPPIRKAAAITSGEESSKKHNKNLD